MSENERTEMLIELRDEKGKSWPLSLHESEKLAKFLREHRYNSNCPKSRIHSQITGKFPRVHISDPDYFVVMEFSKKDYPNLPFTHTFSYRCGTCGAEVRLTETFGYVHDMLVGRLYIINQGATIAD